MSSRAEILARAREVKAEKKIKEPQGPGGVGVRGCVQARLQFNQARSSRVQGSAACYGAAPAELLLLICTLPDLHTHHVKPSTLLE